MEVVVDSEVFVLANSSKIIIQYGGNSWDYQIDRKAKALMKS